MVPTSVERLREGRGILEKVLRSGAKVSQRNESSPTCDSAAEREAGRRSFWVPCWWGNNGLSFVNLPMKSFVPSSPASPVPDKGLLQTVLCYSGDIAWACKHLLVDLEGVQFYPEFGFKITCILALAVTASLPLDRWVSWHCPSCTCVLGIWGYCSTLVPLIMLVGWTSR